MLKQRAIMLPPEIVEDYPIVYLDGVHGTDQGYAEMSKSLLAAIIEEKQTMKTFLPITILPEDFEGSDYCNPQDCPIARAVKRALPYTQVTVRPSSITLSGDVSDLTRCPIPWEVNQKVYQTWLDRKDRNRFEKLISKYLLKWFKWDIYKIKPITFDLIPNQNKA